MAKIECKGCTPNCPYFPYMDGTVDWEYNEEGLKVRKKKRFLFVLMTVIKLQIGLMRVQKN